MVKRKLAITKSPTKGKSVSNEISVTKVQKILEHISTEKFMKFNPQDVHAKVLPTTASTNSKSVVKSTKALKGKGISKKDKMLFKKQRLLQKFDTISVGLKKGLSKKAKKLKKDNQNEWVNSNINAVPDAQNIVDEKIKNEFKEIEKTVQILKKTKKSKSEATFGIKNLLTTSIAEKPRSEKSVRKTTIFRRAKNNSNKNRQKNFNRGLKAYNKELKKEDFVEDPIKAITERVTAYVRRETAV